jgi:hypothetical protein
MQLYRYTTEQALLQLLKTQTGNCNCADFLPTTGKVSEGFTEYEMKLENCARQCKG